MQGGIVRRVLNHQSDLSLALFAMFVSGAVFALLAVTVLPPERPVLPHVVIVVFGILVLVSTAVLITGHRISPRYASWISSVYLLLLVMLVVRASNLSRATIAGFLIVVVIVLFAWFLPTRVSRIVGYTALGFIGLIIIVRFPTNDGILTVIALVSLSVLLTEVFGLFSRNLRRASLVDHLTGAWNRAGFERLLQSSILARDRSGERLSVVYIDLDDFKQVNDERGHSGGDEVLREMVASFTAGVRARDAVARMGGDEFVILLPGAAAGEALKLCERLQQEVVACAWSYGVAEYRTGETADEFIDRADAEVMRMKQARGVER